MADFTITVNKAGVNPAVIYAGNESTYGKTILFQFSPDWNGLTKEIIFYDMRGNAHTEWVASGVEVNIPYEVSAYGGDAKYTVRGFTVEGDYIADELQVTGTIHFSYSAGANPRMEGKLVPSTLDLFLFRAEAFIENCLTEAKESGDFKGDPGEDAEFGVILGVARPLPAGSLPEITLVQTGTKKKKNILFNFGIPKGDKGEKGEDGDPVDVPDGLVVSDGRIYLKVNGVPSGSSVPTVGKNFTILGHFDTLSDLQAAITDPEVGDAYAVGTIKPYNIYVYSGLSGAWENYGPIGSGTSVVDDEMDPDSEDPVQNKIIKAYVDAAVAGAAVTVDSSMVTDSVNPVQSKVIKKYVDDAVDEIEDMIGDVSSAISAINAIVGE